MSSKLRAVLRAATLRRRLERDLSVTAARVEASPTEPRLRRQLRRLQVALLRMRQHDYGKCAACGQPIADARLRRLPTTGTCAACQARLDNEAPKRGVA